METPVNGEASPEENGPVRNVEIMAGEAVEVATEIISRMHLCPRDMITLGLSLICAVKDLGDDRFPNSSPFRHIPKEANPFETAIGVLQEINSWGNGGAEIPEHLRTPE